MKGLLLNVSANLWFYENYFVEVEVEVEVEVTWEADLFVALSAWNATTLKPLKLIRSETRSHYFRTFMFSNILVPTPLFFKCNQIKSWSKMQSQFRILEAELKVKTTSIWLRIHLFHFHLIMSDCLSAQSMVQTHFRIEKDLRILKMTNGRTMGAAAKSTSALEHLIDLFLKDQRQKLCQLQGVFFTGTPLKSSKYKKVNLG